MQSEFEQFRRLHRIMRICVWGFLLFPFVAGGIALAVWGRGIVNIPDLLAFPLVVIQGAFFAGAKIAKYRIETFACPSCGKLFGYSRSRKGAFRCAHCEQSIPRH